MGRFELFCHAISQFGDINSIHLAERECGFGVERFLLKMILLFSCFVMLLPPLAFAQAIPNPQWAIAGPCRPPTFPGKAGNGSMYPGWGVADPQNALEDKVAGMNVCLALYPAPKMRDGCALVEYANPSFDVPPLPPPNKNGAFPTRGPGLPFDVTDTWWRLNEIGFGGVSAKPPTTSYQWTKVDPQSMDGDIRIHYMRKIGSQAGVDAVVEDFQAKVDKRWLCYKNYVPSSLWTGGQLLWISRVTAYCRRFYGDPEAPICANDPDEKLMVTAPANNQLDTVTSESDYISHISLFNTNVVATPIINWSVDLSYQTSGGRGTLTENHTFTSGAGVPMQEVFSSTGGRATVKASATVNGTLQESTVTYYLTGEIIPEDMITGRLLGLYQDGATPRLLTGIAQVESTYRQFTRRSLFSTAALWPTESYDGGSHIGLMQMGIRQDPQYAWDWMLNTQGAADLYREKLARAQRVETRIRNEHPNLRALTPEERENMALVLYGPGASSRLDRQYYRAVLGHGVATWVVNTANNPLGVGYADHVRASMR